MAAFRKIRKPGKDEYPGYSHIYMDLLKDDDLILDHLHENFFKIKEFNYLLPGMLKTNGQQKKYCSRN